MSGKTEARISASIGRLVSEQDLFNQILDLAHIYHWRCAHFRPAMTERGWRTAVAGDGAGYPDLCMVRLTRVLYAELKSEKGKVTEEQQEWLDALKQTGKVEVYVWRPSDFYEIAEILK